MKHKYQKHTKRPQKETHKKYQNIFGEDKEKRQKNVRDRCRNLLRKLSLL